LTSREAMREHTGKIMFAIMTCVGLSACGGAPAAREPGVGEKNILGLAAAVRNVGSKRGRPPADLAEVKAWVTKASPKELQGAGIDDPQAIFVSPRDNEPYVYVKPADMLSPVYVHEKTGVSGKKHMVGYSGSVEEVTDAELATHLAAAKQKSS
jgi:hypothetical protein